MSAARPTRAEARVLQIERIKSTSRRLMAQKGASGLSLREVARELGVVSSALYRYFPTRDDLLTALIVDAYNDLGEFAERAVRTACRAPKRAVDCTPQQWPIRKWAKANPNEYALLYGSPVPGYEAPPFTVEPARASRSYSAPSWSRRGTTPTPRSGTATRWRRAACSRRSLDEVMPGVPESVRARSLMVWSLFFGFITFELFGHYEGTVRNANRFFTLVVDEAVDLVLPAERPR